MTAEQLYELTLEVNGVPHRAAVPARRLLSDALRHDLGLTGTHVGCEHGVCGTCTVLLDGEPIRSCMMLAVQADGHRITTVEGLADPAGELSPVQQAFIECHALQCGFCTPGFLTTITAFLAGHPDPADSEIADAIGGNLCRCTGYQNIKSAVGRAAEIRRERAERDQASPGQAAPGQAAPGQAAPGQAAPGQAAPGQAAEVAR
jgi:carbon-monoxide dehydrogenase small subunit